MTMFIFAYVYIKSVEPVLSLVPRYKGSRIARQVETSNAESPTPMQVYISPTTSTNVKASEDN